MPAILVVVVVVGVGARLGIGNIGAIAAARTTSRSISFGQHLDSRLAGLSAWATSPSTILVGTAFGEYGQLREADGPHSHSPYTTLLPEIGAVGVGLLLAFLASVLVGTWSSTTPIDRSILWLTSMVAFAFLLYEFLALQFIWCLLGAGAASARRTPARPSVVPGSPPLPTASGAR
jgi:hypothetical protein